MVQDGRSAVCSQENGSRGYRWCSIDGGALLELWPRRRGKSGYLGRGRDGEGDIKRGGGRRLRRDVEPLNRGFRIASLDPPEISDRQREVTTGHGDSALHRFPPTCRGEEMGKIVAAAPLIARSLPGHACTRTDARVGDGNV